MSKYFVRYVYKKPVRRIVTGGGFSSFITENEKVEDYAIIDIPDDDLTTSEVLQRVHIDELNSNSNVNYWDIDILVLNKL